MPPLAGVLEGLSRDRLKEVCRALDLDDSGREKVVLIDRQVWRVHTSNGLRQIGSTEWLPIVPNGGIDPGFLYFLCWSEQVMHVAKGQVSGSTPSRQRVDPAAFYRIFVPRSRPRPLRTSRSRARAGGSSVNDR